ncbi:MAG TPA: bifunctional aldolase/short-chain dehydrogenase [Alphaproteobacteria bacterium]|nr:bifunctional aldolase/short-chain dehydrogenase [Alphaproteobacteria bacterium]
MQNLWSDRDAEAATQHYGAEGVSRELALRVYTTRLLGGEPRLVLHGGGNTSLKTRAKDLLGEEVEVLCVKGSGWDMATIEPPGLPAVRLEPLRKLRRLESLSDEDMVNAQRGNLLDSAAPNPSVETLLHAFLPHTYIDHTHANAVLALSDQPRGEVICREVFGRRVAIVPYIMPGFALAKTAAQVFEVDPEVEGLILAKHGIFTFGGTARESYARMIELVSLAEQRLERAANRVMSMAALPRTLASAAEIAPILRGLAALALEPEAGRFTRFVMSCRKGRHVLAYVNGAKLARYGQAGVVTPDHVIRTKRVPLILPAPDAANLSAFARAARDAFASYKASYHTYFARHNALSRVKKKELDPVPRVILVPGVGLFALGASARDARIAGDLAETTIDVVASAERIGRFESISESDTFEMEYWSLEQAKLGKAAEKPLQRQIVAVTGGGSGIGAATAAAFAAHGAEVAILDRDEALAESVAKRIGGLALACDVTDGGQVAAAFARISERYGGVDIVVSNAGAAWQGRIGEVADRALRESFELNFFAHQSVARQAVAIMRAQGTGGCLLFNTSKQAVNPGPDFGPYGLPKAATLFLMRQYAIDYGKDGIRSNAVNADRIRSGLLTDGMIAARAKARGLSEREYMAGNLLAREVTAADVAQCFVSLALAEKTTGAVLTCDGGNVAAALR